MANLEKITVEELDGEDLDKKFSDFFELKDFIGRGAFGSVVKATKVGDNRVYAVKVIQKKTVSENEIEKLKEEAYILAEMNHPNIVKFRDIQETESKLFIVMEYVKDGSLKDLIIARRKEGIKFSDLEASILMKSILSAVAYMHTNNIVHRDLKPENILVGDVNDVSSMKIADFGLSANFCKEGFMQSSLTQKAGTLIYMAPEYVNSKIYSKPVDLWSCACIMYILLSGGVHPLYSSRDDSESYKTKLLNPKWEYKDFFTPLAKDLFIKMTKINPLERITADDCLKHPWITRKNEEIPLTANELFKTFSIQTQFARICKALYLIELSLNRSPGPMVEYHDLALKLARQHSSEYREIKMKRKPKNVDDNLLSNLVGAIRSRADSSDILSLKGHEEEDHASKIPSRFAPDQPNPTMKKSGEPKVIKPNPMKKSLTKRHILVIQQGVPSLTLDNKNSTESPNNKITQADQPPKIAEIPSITERRPSKPQEPKPRVIEIQIETLIEVKKQPEDANKQLAQLEPEKLKPKELILGTPSKSLPSNEFRITTKAPPLLKAQETKSDSRNSPRTDDKKPEAPKSAKNENSTFFRPSDPKSGSPSIDSKIPGQYIAKKVQSDPVKPLISPKAKLSEKFQYDSNKSNSSISKTEPPTIATPNNSEPRKKTASGTRPYSYAAPLSRPEKIVNRQGDFFVYNFSDTKLPEPTFQDTNTQLRSHQLSTPDLVKLSKNLIIKANVEMDLTKNLPYYTKISSVRTRKKFAQKMTFTKTGFHQIAKTAGGPIKIHELQQSPAHKTLTSPKELPDILLRGQSINISERDRTDLERKHSKILTIAVKRRESQREKMRFWAQRR